MKWLPAESISNPTIPLQISSVIGTGRVVGSGPATNGSFAVNGLGGDNVAKLEEVLITCDHQNDNLKGKKSNCSHFET